MAGDVTARSSSRAAMDTQPSQWEARVSAAEAWVGSAESWRRPPARLKGTGTRGAGHRQHSQSGATRGGARSEWQVRRAAGPCVGVSQERG